MILRSIGSLLSFVESLLDPEKNRDDERRDEFKHPRPPKRGREPSTTRSHPLLA